MGERYIPTTLRRLLGNMKEAFYDWLPSPLDGGLQYDENVKKEMEEKYGIRINTERVGDDHFYYQPTYKVTVEKGEEKISFRSGEEIPKKWKFRLRSKPIAQTQKVE